MKDFHRSFICRSTETGKKGHRNKHQSNKNEVCKCYAPFLKLHYYDCPVARKPCPIHGSPYRQCAKDEKAEKKEDMIISFHPSSKTDKLFKPVKNLLAHCNPETKINLEYYSSNNPATKDGMKHRQVQTNPEDFKNSLGGRVFMEKTKSFVTDKTNKMKRLKQCFHSPCNSIVARTRSEITIKNKINETFREVPKHAAIPTNIPEEPPDMYLYERSKWTSSNKLDSSDWEKSSDDKVESDFLTVTKQVENKVIDHKIFEIKHKKGFGDIRFTKLPRQAPFVYSSYDMEKPKDVSTDLGVQAEPPKNQKNLEKYSKDNELMKQNKTKKEDVSSSEKSQSSSSGSIYFTPLILIPEGRANDTSDESKYADDVLNERSKNLDDEVKPVGGKALDTKNMAVQTEALVLGKNMYDLSSTSDNSTVTKSSESVKEPVALKQDRGVGSGNVFARDKYDVPEEVGSRGSKASRKNTFSVTDVTQTTGKSQTKSTQMTPPKSPPTHDYDLYDDLYNKKDKAKRDNSLSETKEILNRLEDGEPHSVKVQTDVIQKREVSLVYDRIKNVADKIIQTIPVSTRDVKVETMATKKNKSQMTYSTFTKSVQTSFTLSDSRSQEEEGVDSEPKVVAPSYIPPDSLRDVRKSRWKKSHSDGDLYNEQSGESANENLISIHHVCLCENSETSNSESDYNGYEKISKPEITDSEKSSARPVIQNQGEPTPNAIRKDVTSKGEQTSLSDLSELARMVDQFFYKMSKEAFKSCDCEKIKKKESKPSPGIRDDSVKSIKKPKEDMSDAEKQTVFKGKVDFSPEEDKTKEKIYPSADQRDVGETIFVCKMCRRKVCTVVAHTSTTTDSLERAQTPKKEALFITVGTSTDDLVVSKRSIGVCVSDYNFVNCFVKRRCATECVSTSELYTSAVPKSSLGETKSFFVADSKNQTGKDWLINITNMKCPAASDKPAPKGEGVNDPNKTPDRKGPTTTNQLTEKIIIKKPRNSDTWKSANYSLLSETHERHTVCKPSDASKAKPVPGKPKSCIPTATSSPRKNINFKEKEQEISKMSTQIIFTQGTNKQSFRSQKDPNAPSISFNRNTVCICDHASISDGKPPRPKSKTEPSTSKACDQKPPLPKKPEQLEESSSRTNKGAPGQGPPKKPSGQKKAIVLPAIIRPMWYKDFKKTLQMIKKSQGHYLHDSESSILKQKRFLEEEDDSPGGKKIKVKEDGSGESYELDQSFFTLNGKQTADLRNDPGFVWYPSSAQEISKEQAHPNCFLKGTQSESKLPRNNLQNSNLFKGFNKRTANVLSVRSCRLKPVQVNEKHPFKKLFECRLCKSLNFLKTNQKDTLQNKQPSEGSFGYESSKSKDESLTPEDENSEPPSGGFSAQIQEEFLVEYSFSSDSGGSADLSENGDFLDDDREGKIEGVDSRFFSSPESQQADSSSNMPLGSTSFDTFWFGRDSRK